MVGAENFDNFIMINSFVDCVCFFSLRPAN